MWVLLRVLIGGILAGAALGKLLVPYQNFLYAVQAYELLPSWAEVLTAQIFPWIELFVGTFVVLGLWTNWALKGALVLFGIFVVVVGQGLIRGLPLENCGCFGGLIHFKPQAVLVMDSAGILLTWLLWRNMAHTRPFSLDAYFDKV